MGRVRSEYCTLRHEGSWGHVGEELVSEYSPIRGSARPVPLLVNLLLLLVQFGFRIGECDELSHSRIRDNRIIVQQHRMLPARHAQALVDLQPSFSLRRSL
jgi:hypothetical protein